MAKMADLPVNVAVTVFKTLNLLKIKVLKDECGNRAIVAFTSPDKLRYPKGWYYAKGTFRNKHNSTNGQYSEVIMLMPNGRCWDEFLP